MEGCARRLQVLANIASSVCAACTYLHEANPPVVVRLTQSNILLDGYMAAKARRGPAPRPPNPMWGGGC